MKTNAEISVPPPAGPTQPTSPPEALATAAASAVPPSAGETQPTSPPCVVSPRWDSSPGSAGALVSVADVSAIYRGPTFIMAREQLCATRQITMPRLLEWITTFDTMLIERGERYKTPNDYARHFRSWLIYQDLTKPPGHTTTQIIKTKTQPLPKPATGIPLRSADELLRERAKKRAG